MSQTLSRSFNRLEALARLDGDTDLLREVVSLFLEECPRLMAELRRGVEARDGPSVFRTAHTLKGSVGNLSGAQVFECAGRLESLGRQGDLDGAGSCLDRLEHAVCELCESLEAYVRGS